MPVLSIFYGIIVRMYREQGGKHNMPHIHAEYSGEEIVMALDGTILEGGFPKNKLKLLEACISVVEVVVGNSGDELFSVTELFSASVEAAVCFFVVALAVFDF